VFMLGHNIFNSYTIRGKNDIYASYLNGHQEEDPVAVCASCC
jgi:hypothetical protein